MKKESMKLQKAIVVSLFFSAMTTATAATGENGMNGRNAFVAEQTDGKVIGRVVDAAGEPIIGASVKVVGATSGAITDFDGNFELNAAKGTKLEVSYVGFVTAQVSARNNMTVTLKEDETALNEVVVTALGIKKEAKALSYNVQQVKSDEFTTVKDANFINSLAGKVAGVNINTSSSGIGGAAKVVMRGAKSISGNNNALYVVDGIPMPTLSTAQPNDRFTGMGQSGDGASMINPEDIESMSVLSGAAASALYGSDAANGVIMITTKKGTKNHTSVSYSNNTSFLSPFVTPEFQNTYGATPGGYTSWGQKLETASNYNPLDFFQTGWNETNSVTLSTGNDKNQTFISLAATNAEGIIQNNTLDRYNVAIRNTTSMLNDKLRLDLTANYMNIKENNMISQGQYFNPLVPVYLMSPSYNLDTYKYYSMYDESRGIRTQFWPWGNMGIAMQNPYWEIMEDNFTNHKDRFMVSAGLTYDICKGISVSGRAKADITSMTAEKKYAATTDGIFAGENGAYYKADDKTRQLYADAMLNIDKYFGDFSLAATLGASIKDVNYNWSSVGGDLNSVANLFTLRNLNQSNAKYDQSGYHDQTQSIFATAQLGWKSSLYLDLTARNDWSSALAYTETKSVAYPSVGLSAIITELIPGLRGNKVLSFLKVRGSYSEVGNAPTRFIAYQTYPLESGTPSTMSTYPNTNIKPERTKAWELGLQANLWREKLQLNVSLYNTATYNQLFNPTLPSSSGYSSIFINGGRVDNKGIEASLTLNQPLGPVNWTSSVTYTLNRNKIKKLLQQTTLDNGLSIEGQNHLDVFGLENVMSRLTEGGSIGDLYVTALKTDHHGMIQVDYMDHTVVRDLNAGPLKDGWIYAGNANAKFTMGWRNTFNWKGITLGFLITGRFGGIAVSETQGYLDKYGVSKASAVARDNGGALVNGSPLTVIGATEKYFNTTVGSRYVYSATNIRLGEVNVGYDLPVPASLSWIEGINVALTGRNLLMFYCKAPFDPELTASTGTHFYGMDNFMTPSLRNLGFSVKVKFGASDKKKEAVRVVPEVQYVEKVVENVVEKPVVKEVVKEVSTDNIFVVTFAQNSDVINNTNQLAGIKAGTTVEVVAYASPEGTKSYNEQLSQRRADAVAKYLESKGVTVKRTVARGADSKHANRIAIVTVQ